MRWLRRHRVRSYLRTSGWLVPASAIPLAIVAAPCIRWLDAKLQWQGLGYSAEGAKSLLNTFTPATLTFIVLILSALLLSIQLASSQFSPRLIGGILARRPIVVCLSIFVFSYVYCVAALGRIEERVPQLPMIVAIALTMISVGAGLYLVDYMAKELRPVRMLARTATVGRRVIEQVYPEFHTTAGSRNPAAEGARPVLPEPCETVMQTKRSGVLVAMDVKGLCEIAREADGSIEVIPQVGDFIARGDPLFRVHPGRHAVKPSFLRESLAIGNERTPEQDPMFVFRILVDVACKALSPAVNDPTTAVLAIDQVHHLLRQVGLRRLDTGEVHDSGGQLRLLYRTPDWEDFVLLGVAEIRQYGVTSIQVARRLHAMLENLISIVPQERRPVLEEQLRLLRSGVKRSFEEPEDRLRAEMSDMQGMGGSRDDTRDRPDNGPVA